MLSFSHTFRVRYSETDQMGIVNNAQYATYYEIGRTEFFRNLGLSYALLEKSGTMLPVSELFVKYFQSAYYDECLTINTTINQMPTSRLRFDYEIYNEKGDLINKGYALLAFINAVSRRPCRVPDLIKNVLEPYFLNQ
jgi:acyl-CoA thioester hydrolase